MRARASEASGKHITFDMVAHATLRPGVDGQKLRQSIETLADQDSGTLRNTPPHVLKTDRVLQSRDSELQTFRAIHSAVINTIELSSAAKIGNVEALEKLQAEYVEAYKAIDITPGSTQDRRQLESLLRNQAISVDASAHQDFISSALKQAENAYLDAGAAEILSRYGKTIERSTDYDM